MKQSTKKQYSKGKVSKKNKAALAAAIQQIKMKKLKKEEKKLKNEGVTYGAGLFKLQKLEVKCKTPNIKNKLC